MCPPTIPQTFDDHWSVPIRILIKLIIEISQFSYSLFFDSNFIRKEYTREKKNQHNIVYWETIHKTTV